MLLLSILFLSLSYLFFLNLFPTYLLGLQRHFFFCASVKLNLPYDDQLRFVWSYLILSYGAGSTICRKLSFKLLILHAPPCSPADFSLSVLSRWETVPFLIFVLNSCLMLWERWEWSKISRSMIQTAKRRKKESHYRAIIWLTLSEALDVSQESPVSFITVWNKTRLIFRSQLLHSLITTSFLYSSANEDVLKKLKHPPTSSSVTSSGSVSPQTKVVFTALFYNRRKFHVRVQLHEQLHLSCLQLWAIL